MYSGYQLSLSINRCFNTVFKKKAVEIDHTLVTTLRSQVETMRLQSSASTHKNRVTAVNTFERFVCATNTPVTIRSLTPDHIKAFERWALDEGMSPGYVALHMRSLRALFNHLDGRGSLLFKHVRTANCQTQKRAVSEATIRQIRELPLPDRSSQALARDIFLFCFFGMGIPLIDAVRLKKSQLIDGHITYRRQKTGRMVRIKVGKELIKLINQLSPPDSPYLLPVLSTTDKTVIPQQYRRFYQRYMRALSKISQQIGLDHHLTSYTPRHSWASIAYKLNGNVNTIAQALGHANANITYAYIKEIGNKQLEQVNELVMQAVQ